MARKLRVEYAGAIYHAMNRGDRREPIFVDDADRQHFTEALGEACQKTGWQVHAWCLMANHFHLVVETPQSNLVAGMKWFLGTCTSQFNRRQLDDPLMIGHDWIALDAVDGLLGLSFLKWFDIDLHFRSRRLEFKGPSRKHQPQHSPNTQRAAP